MLERADVLKKIGWEVNVYSAFSEVTNEALTDLVSSDGQELMEPNFLPVEDEATLFAQLNAILKDNMRNKSAIFRSKVFQFHIHCVYSSGKTPIETKGYLNFVELPSANKPPGQLPPQINEEYAAGNSVLMAIGTLLNKIANKDRNISFDNCRLASLLQMFFSKDSKTLIYFNVTPLFSDLSTTAKVFQYSFNVRNTGSQQPSANQMQSQHQGYGQYQGQGQQGYHLQQQGGQQGYQDRDNRRGPHQGSGMQNWNQGGQQQQHNDYQRGNMSQGDNSGQNSQQYRYSYGNQKTNQQSQGQYGHSQYEDKSSRMQRTTQETSQQSHYDSFNASKDRGAISVRKSVDGSDSQQFGQNKNMRGYRSKEDEINFSNDNSMGMALESTQIPQQQGLSDPMTKAKPTEVQETAHQSGGMHLEPMDSSPSSLQAAGYASQQGQQGVRAAQYGGYDRNTSQMQQGNTSQPNTMFSNNLNQGGNSSFRGDDMNNRRMQTQNAGNYGGQNQIYGGNQSQQQSNFGSNRYGMSNSNQPQGNTDMNQNKYPPRNQPQLQNTSMGQSNQGTQGNFRKNPMQGSGPQQRQDMQQSQPQQNQYNQSSWNQQNFQSQPSPQQAQQGRGNFQSQQGFNNQRNLSQDSFQRDDRNSGQFGQSRDKQPHTQSFQNTNNPQYSHNSSSPSNRPGHNLHSTPSKPQFTDSPQYFPQDQALSNPSSQPTSAHKQPPQQQQFGRQQPQQMQYGQPSFPSPQNRPSFDQYQQQPQQGYQQQNKFGQGGAPNRQYGQQQQQHRQYPQQQRQYPNK